MFIHLYKAFHTVDHNVLLKKLEVNGILGKNLNQFKIYLNNRKQYIQINNEEKPNLLLVKWSVLQGACIRASSFFHIYINDLQFVTQVLHPIMFDDEKNLFYLHNDINDLFLKENDKLHKINQWFVSNKTPLNQKNKYKEK